mgnify:CR=1 FL=1
MVSQCTASRPTITAWTLLTLGSRPHTGEQEQAHVPLCTVSTDRLKMVPFMHWGYITDISLHVMKPFDHRKAENPVLEFLKRSTLSGILRPLTSQLALDPRNLCHLTSGNYGALRENLTS